MHLKSISAPGIPSRLWAMVLLCRIACCALQTRAQAEGIVIWDTISGTGGNLESRTNWKAVPTDLFSLEKNPPKASSDPGYYGREYVFKGDTIVENEKILAVIPAEKGGMIFYGKSGEVTGAGPAHLQKTAEIIPLHGSASPIHIAVIRNAGDEAVLEVSWNENATGGSRVLYSFDKTQIVAIKPSKEMEGVQVLAPIEYGVLPGFVGDDLIFGPTERGESDSIALPSENLLLALVNGENTTLTMTWPKVNQKIRLVSNKKQTSKGTFGSIDFENDGESFYLALQSAPGIWHKEDLDASFLEKDVAIKWTKPFPAKWQTELLETGIKTRFGFSESKREIWRGVPGSYNYPVWFEGDTAYYHLSKKVPPKGESLIYFLEGDRTPAFISTPVDILKVTLGRPFAETILDDAGRKLRTHHRRGGTGVRRACTCGCTEAIQAYFEEGQEAANKTEITEALSDMTYFVERHVARIAEYRHGAEEMIQFLQARTNSNPDLKAYAENLTSVAQQILEEYNVQQENMKSPAYASELMQKTLALTDHSDKQNLAAYMNLLKDWRAMGGAQDYVVAQCHAVTRKLFQEAGYSCASQPKTVKLAEEVRQRCRLMLRSPDGYEIWPNY